MKNLFVLSFMFICLSCEQKSITKEQAVAKVHDKYLFRSEITQLIPKGTSSQDSILIAQKYIHKWITKELLLRKAQQNLTDEEKNIRQQIEEYSSSILIHKYKEKLIAQKLEDQINDSEIEHYYEQYKQNFILSSDIVRSLLIIIPKSVSNIAQVRKWIRSNDSTDYAHLEEYCIMNAKKYDHFNDQCVELLYLLNILPILPS